MTSRLASRIRRLENVIRPEPFVMSDRLRQTVDRMIDGVRRLVGEEPTPETIERHLGRVVRGETQ